MSQFEFTPPSIRHDAEQAAIAEVEAEITLEFYMGYMEDNKSIREKLVKIGWRHLKGRDNFGPEGDKTSIEGL